MTTVALGPRRTRTAHQPDTMSPVLQRVRLLAVRDPHRTAVIADDQRLSYSELWYAVQELAEELGPRPGVVPVSVRHEASTIVSLLGIWEAGGTYCPIDPNHPVGHVDTLLATVGDDTVDPDTAYVLFTSGSSGRPKPVAVPHRAVSTVVPALGRLFDIDPLDRVLQVASLCWDTAFEEILPTLAGGATVVFGQDAHAGSLPRLLRLVERETVTVLDLPTALWHELVLHLSEAGEGLPTSVRLVVIGGEGVDPARLEAWRGLPGSSRIRLLNTYGATETVMITHAADLHGPGGTQPAAPIGRPLPHVRQRIDADGQLHVGGPALATGYAGLPEATAERFTVVDGERWYATGDLVEHAPDGMLHHRGRADAQVKVRGIRVDPAEVEAALTASPEVAAAAVTGVTLAGRTVLAAYVVPRRADDDATRLVAELRAFLRATAPGHLHPARLTVVPALALTASGKVDRRATHAEYSAPVAPRPDPEPTTSPTAQEATA